MSVSIGALFSALVLRGGLTKLWRTQPPAETHRCRSKLSKGLTAWGTFDRGIRRTHKNIYDSMDFQQVSQTRIWDNAESQEVDGYMATHRDANNS